MTDNEIIKALECDTHTNCEECPYFRETCSFDDVQAKDILDLINRQQVEIEKHKSNCEKCGAKTRECIESLHNIIAEQQAEIKELNTIRSRLIYDSGTLTKIFDELYQKIKAEAVKEFAEMLKARIIEDFLKYNTDTTIGYIDNLVKEMVGEE